MNLMHRMTDCRKAQYKILITIFSMIILLVIFAIAFFLFKLESNKMDKRSVLLDFSSVDTELTLKTFLRTPVYDPGVANMKPVIKGYMNYADLISSTCSQPRNTPYHNLLSNTKYSSSIISHFSGLYQEKKDGSHKWGVKIIYSDASLEPWTFGNVAKYESGIVKKLKESGNPGNELDSFTLSYRSEGFSSQLLPCSSGGIAKVMFFTEGTSSGLSIIDKLAVSVVTSMMWGK